jgi:hypothetical protein
MLIPNIGRLCEVAHTAREVEAQSRYQIMTKKAQVHQACGVNIAMLVLGRPAPSYGGHRCCKLAAGT